MTAWQKTVLTVSLILCAAAVFCSYFNQPFRYEYHHHSYGSSGAIHRHYRFDRQTGVLAEIIPE